jgi:[ribosomal protein S5]-alanine N-acetyltransferase
MINFKLRKWQLSDADSIVKYANNEKITAFMSDGFPNPFTYEKALNFIKNTSANPGNHYFAITINDEAVGGIGISVQSDIHRKNAELGYWLAEDFWGKGIATQAVKEIVDYGFKNCDIVRIFARPLVNNIASHRVLIKAGFDIEATHKNAVFKNGVCFDELIYSVLKADSSY